MSKRWISTIRHIQLTPDPNQEPRTGYLFGVKLFEGEEMKLSFSPNDIAGNYYLYSKELEKQLSDLSEKVDKSKAPSSLEPTA